MYTTDLNDDIMCKTKSGNKIYWMLTTEQGAQNFEMRYIEIPPGEQVKVVGQDGLKLVVRKNSPIGGSEKTE